jgi:sirohydrochlorin ferrochelatase
VKLSEPTAVLLVGHGSRAKGFDKAMTSLAKSLKKSAPYRDVSCAFLEIVSPSIPEAIDRAVERGAKTLKLLPYFVHLGNHVKKDIPEIIKRAKKKHPSVQMVLCPYLGYDEHMVKLILRRLSESYKKF